MDEKLMMMEQDRQTKEKKRKNNRKKLRIVGAILLVIAIAAAVSLWWSASHSETEDTTVQISVKNGQEIIYAALTSVKGNEITYQVAQEMQEKEAEAVSSDETMQRGEMPEGGDMPQMPEMGEMPEGGFSGMEGEMSRGDGTSQGRGGRGEMSGNMPDMAGFSGGMSRTMAGASTAGSFTYNDVTYELTEETVTALIPVGTDVTTKLGTVTTFSRLAAGDIVGLVVEEQNGEQIITAVYIID